MKQDTNAGLPNKIEAFVHCARCLREKPNGISPQDWAELSIGMTPTGLQVWCNRHNTNVVLFIEDNKWGN